MCAKIYLFLNKIVLRALKKYLIGYLTFNISLLNNVLNKNTKDDFLVLFKTK